MESSRHEEVGIELREFGDLALLRFFRLARVAPFLLYSASCRTLSAESGRESLSATDNGTTVRISARARTAALVAVSGSRRCSAGIRARIA